MMIKMPEHTERLDAQGFGLNNFEKIFNYAQQEVPDF